MNPTMRKILRACHLYDVIIDLKKWMSREDAVYEAFYRQFISPGDLCFDVGANMGRRTQVFLKCGAKVIAVEPQDHCMARLRRRFARNSNVTLLQQAVGATPGQAQMQLCDSHSLSSLSSEWIDSVRQSGRYAACKWDRTATVTVTTLDELIARYGLPSFIKIDVEGFEHEVIKGLSQPVKMLCFEFTPECCDAARRCVEQLGGIGPVRFNYCNEERWTEYALESWVDAGEMSEVLTSMAQQNIPGDIYARFESAGEAAGD